MSAAIVTLAIGMLIFFAHYFAHLFQRTRIPDVLFLMGAGILLGPVLNLLTPAHFGMLGPVFSAITLVFILFESGLDLDLESLKESIGGSFTLTFLNFIVTMHLVAGMSWWWAGLPWLQAFLLGAILGGTSSAVVVTVARSLKLNEGTVSALVVESALSDVFTLAVPLTFMSAILAQNVEIGLMAGQLVSALGLAVTMGFGGGIIWAILQRRLPSLQETRFTTPAFAFIIYGVAEILGFSGPIAALVFGLTVGNIFYLRKWLRRPMQNKPPIFMGDQEKNFFAEMVFLLRTFFFIYVGISMKFGDLPLLGLSAVITLLLFIVRIPVVKVSLPKDAPVFDRAVASVMIPKGLGAAVLATLPFQKGVPGGDTIQAMSFGVILFSTLYSVIGVYLIENAGLDKLYGLVFRMPKEVSKS